MWASYYYLSLMVCLFVCLFVWLLAFTTFQPFWGYLYNLPDLNYNAQLGCYTHNVSPTVISDFLRCLFLVICWRQGISNWSLYSINGKKHSQSAVYVWENWKIKAILQKRNKYEDELSDTKYSLSAKPFKIKDIKFSEISQNFHWKLKKI